MHSLRIAPVFEHDRPQRRNLLGQPAMLTKIIQSLGAKRRSNSKTSLGVCLQHHLRLVASEEAEAHRAVDHLLTVPIRTRHHHAQVIVHEWLGVLTCCSKVDEPQPVLMCWVCWACCVWVYLNNNKKQNKTTLAI